MALAKLVVNTRLSTNRDCILYAELREALSEEKTEVRKVVSALSRLVPSEDEME